MLLRHPPMGTEDIAEFVRIIAKQLAPRCGSAVVFTGGARMITREDDCLLLKCNLWGAWNVS